MSLDFPSAPSPGEQFDNWEWDGTKWIALGIPAGPPGPPGPPGPAGAATISDVPPSSPTDGDLWWDTVGAQLYIWEGAQWVVVVNQPVPELTPPPITVVKWTSRSVPLNSGGLFSVIYGGQALTNDANLYVAVSSTGAVITSTDGIVWTTRTSALAGNLMYSVIYANAIYVAVGGPSATGNVDSVMTSSDGVNWTARSAAVSTPWTAVAYGAGLFVAVGVGAIMTSPDGINWTAQTAPDGGASWASIAYGAGLFVAVAITGFPDQVMTSPDGINWTLRAVPTPNQSQWRSVIYADGQFVAVASQFTGVQQLVMTSPDGINWTSYTVPTHGWFSVAYGLGMFVAVASSPFNLWGPQMMTSPDAINWTQALEFPTNSWVNIIFANGQFVASNINSQNSSAIATGVPTLIPPGGF